MIPQGAAMPNSNANLSVHDLALQFVELRSAQTMLSREVSTNVQNLSSATQSLQSDVRHLVEQMSEFARLQQQQINHSEGLERAFSEIGRVARSFEAYRDKQDALFEAYRAATDTRHGTIAEKVTDYSGRFKGIWLSLGLVVALGTALCGVAWDQLRGADADLKAQFADAKAERVALEARIKAAHDDDTARLQRQIDALAARQTTSDSIKGAR
jgi:outer membrane murein-binding lipoprotein Lpp